MIEKIQNYLHDRKLERTIRKVRGELAASELSFEAFEDKYVKESDDQKKLLTYCILLVSGNQTPIRTTQRFNAVLREYAESLDLALELKSVKLAILLQRECARERFVKR
jgi:hypothetical protein